MIEIDTQAHGQLLYKISLLPYEKAEQYRKELQAAYADYLASLANYEILMRTIEPELKWAFYYGAISDLMPAALAVCSENANNNIRFVLYKIS